MKDARDISMEREQDKIVSITETEVETKVEDSVDDDESPIVKFKKPYVFEKVEYKEIDLSGLDELTAADMIAVNRLMNRTSPGIDVMPEVSLEYALNIASKATKLPIEFFLGLPPKYATAVKSRVMGFLFGSD